MLYTRVKTILRKVNLRTWDMEDKNLEVQDSLGDLSIFYVKTALRQNGIDTRALLFEKIGQSVWISGF